jgi:Protein of unknown function (DUF1566)
MRLMHRPQHHLTLVFCVSLLGVARLARADGAADYTYQVLFDADNNAATGCSVPVDDTTVGSTTVDGVERLVTVTVMRTGMDGTITGITVRNCVNGTWGAAQPVSSGGWPVGNGDGVGGGDVIEGFVPAAALGNGGLARVAFTASRATPGSDVMLSTTGESGGAPILFPIPHHAPAPLLSPTGLALSVLLLGGVAWWALRRRLSPRQAFLLALAVTASAAATAVALTVVTDGQVGDWDGLPPVATDPTGDSTNHDPAEDLVAGFLTTDDTTVYLRLDVVNLNPCESKTNGMTCDAGMDFASAVTCEDGTCGTCVAQASPSPRFVDNGDGTITDRQTCLVWEKKDQSGTIHDWGKTYPWSGDCTSETACSSGGTCCETDTDCAAGHTCTITDGQGTGLTIFGWVAQLNSASFAGHQDWRLPSEDGQKSPFTGPKELESILAAPFLCSVGPPCVATAFNMSCTTGCTATGTPCSCTRSGPYWAATAAANPILAEVVDFGTGFAGATQKSNFDYVRAVRGGL